MSKRFLSGIDLPINASLKIDSGNILVDQSGYWMANKDTLLSSDLGVATIFNGNNALPFYDRGPIAINDVMVLNANKTGTTTGQFPIFDTSIITQGKPLVGGVIYEIEIAISCTTGTTTATNITVAPGGGTLDGVTPATGHQLRVISTCVAGNNAATPSVRNIVQTSATTGGFTLTASSSNAGSYGIFIKGVLRAPAGGMYWLPTMSSTVSSGAAPVVLANSYAKATPLSGNSGNTYDINSWS
jgi:hypothetical protein